ncbi:hypothetical protein [Paenibacillus mucilaginosus]|uniref:Uncharacterized protein n=1 Tax=Paenibacillus mucilaginosus (strain KNP414) TaxID=1036673 RepID=F8FRA4_PAEMK|nr:hypothetical protein [Paenibacillus mucilaginosus]AEI39354.1 hypothetical protein KNP414_00764 [Paenibacillus mucilaginosus KNP414]MCG7216945.1 hypothetical protein [Paenibacillus mucilaginosus]WDM28344.1 hypothetical protein KCX80_03620 [Paenibacillus mucilaginosus]
MNGVIGRLIDEVTSAVYENDPHLLERYGERGRVKCREDNEHHFRHLETAYLMKEKAIFTDYALWLSEILSRHGMEPGHLIDNFREIDAALQRTPELSVELREGYGLLLDAAVHRLRQLERQPGGGS